MAAPQKAPASWDTQYGITLRHSNFRATAKATGTAGLKCAPLIPPDTWPASITANPQPKMLISQLSGPNGTVCLPEPGRPTTLTAQVPRPSSNTTKVPKNSASIAPASPARSLVKVLCLGSVSVVKVVNVVSPN